MTPRDSKFRQAAWTYLLYGLIYMGGAVYLAGQGIGPQGMSGRSAALVWFVFGALFILVFPWLIAKGARGVGYLWFTRLLTLAVAYRAFEVGRIALKGGPAMPAIGGGVFPTQVGAWIFFLITLGTVFMLARASWSRQ
ncbi:MAG TPA: hypothetical protein VJO34_16925 [Methylomirabilota bacterium]|nr:hypothetical protein [Methylomirabilota bacterium]